MEVAPAIRIVAAVTGAAILVSGCGASDPQRPRTTVTAPFDAVTDFSDLRRLAGASDAVFIGEVLEQSGTKSLDSTPETQFRVSVLETLKGQLKSTVTVNQEGGVREDSNELVLIGGDELLTVGDQYLFATRFLSSENWYTLIPNFGDRRLTDNTAKAATTGAPVTSRSKLVTDMRGAIENEIPFSAGG